ncbi:hypothetical protein [Desulfosarcina sp.]
MFDYPHRSDEKNHEFSNPDKHLPQKGDGMEAGDAARRGEMK